MELRVSRASAVVVQRVPAAVADWFVEWQGEVAAAAEGFPGYRGTDVYPPPDSQTDEWVVVINFDEDDALQRWLVSAVRGEFVEKLRAKVGDFELQSLPGGFGFWFRDRSRATGTVPPSWKLAATVLLALYPTVMLLTIFVGPYTSPFGLAVSMLIGNALSISILQWGVMPLLTSLLRPWLKADLRRSWAYSAGGLCLLFLLLAISTLLFRQVTG